MELLDIFADTTKEDLKMGVNIYHNGTLCTEYENASKEKEKIKRQRDRLLTLATKHCDRDHKDWQSILKIAKAS